MSLPPHNLLAYILQYVKLFLKDSLFLHLESQLITRGKFTFSLHRLALKTSVRVWMGTPGPLGAALAGGGGRAYLLEPWRAGKHRSWQSPGGPWGRQPIEAGQTALTVVTGSVVLAGLGHTCGEGAWLWPDEQAPELPTNNLQSKEKKKTKTQNKSPDTPI